MLCFVCFFSANPRQSRPDVAGSRIIGPSSSLGAVQDRLKPPVSAVNMDRKVIKLGGSKNTSSLSPSKDQIQNNSHPLKQPAISESNSVSASRGDSNVLATDSSRKIRLSQPGTASAAEKPQQQQNPVNVLPAKRMSDSAGENEKKKFKATAITWP